MRKGEAFDIRNDVLRTYYCVWITRPGPCANFSIDAELSRTDRARLVNAYRKDVQHMRREARGQA
jgi:hypothetical protein